MGKKKNYLLLTSGGDAPGMNAAIRAAVRTGMSVGAKMFATTMGFEGLIQRDLIPLDEKSVANCIQRGGTILKSARSVDFMQASVQKKAARFLAKKKIDGVIVLGGNGSFQGAMSLHAAGGPAVIGIPCTIDNDIVGTDYTIGFDTCCNTALQAIDKIRDTALSFDNDFLIEVMGRSSGFIACEVGIAGGAELILTPEFPMSTDAIIQKILHRKREKLASIIVAAESGDPGRTIDLAKAIKAKTGHDYRVCILGHTQRGGTPTVRDRFIATQMGHHAITLLEAGESGKMVCSHNGGIGSAAFPPPELATRYLDDQSLLRMNQTIS